MTNRVPTSRTPWILLWAGALTIAAACAPEAPQSDSNTAAFDILITNARVIDGAGNPWIRADVGIRGDHIVGVGRLTGQPATRTIDAQNRCLQYQATLISDNGDRYPVLDRVAVELRK